MPFCTSQHPPPFVTLQSSFKFESNQWLFLSNDKLPVHIESLVFLVCAALNKVF